MSSSVIDVVFRIEAVAVVLIVTSILLFLVLSGRRRSTNNNQCNNIDSGYSKRNNRNDYENVYVGKHDHSFNNIIKYMTQNKKCNEEKERRRKEQIAYSSFRVRGSDLMEISGRKTAKIRRRGNSSKYAFDRNKRERTNSIKDHPDFEDGNRGSILVEILLNLSSKLAYPIIIVISTIVRWYDAINSSEFNVTTVNSRKSTIPRGNLTEDYYDNSVVLGMDCEMVGGGRGGKLSLLARCSIVTLDHVPIRTAHKDENPESTKEHSTLTHNDETPKKLNNLNKNLVVLYDKYVIPKGKIKDYRTQWSGITRDTLFGDDSNRDIPIVSFGECQKEVSQIFSSTFHGGKTVIVVGHALSNDFDALEIKHPNAQIRDTATYHPFMLHGRGRRRMLPRKLSALASDELGIDIQQQSHQRSYIENGKQNHGMRLKNSSMIGHSSVEDAAAALRLYWHRYDDWEHSLRYPLAPMQSPISIPFQQRPPLEMYLDGCNLPIGMRGIKMKDYIKNYQMETQGNGKASMTIPSKFFQLISKSNRDHGHDSTSIDFFPFFQSLLYRRCIIPTFSDITIMWDGSKFRDIMDKSDHIPGNDYKTKVFTLEPSSSTKTTYGAVTIEITFDGDAVDDVLYHRCAKDVSNTSPRNDEIHGKIVSLNKVTELFSKNDGNSDILSHYIVIRRKAGGTKTHRRLFDKLHLRRPEEGAVFLTGLTSKLQLDSWKIAKELLRERGVEKVIECELRSRDELRYVVVTDDVFLTERLARSGVTLVLSYRQLERMF